MIPRQDKRGQEVEKSVSKTLSAEKMSSERKAIEKKAKRTYRSSISGDTVSLGSTLSSNVSMGTEPFDPNFDAPKCDLTSADPFSTDPKNASNEAIPKKVPKLIVPKVISKRNSQPKTFVEKFKIKKVPKSTCDKEKKKTVLQSYVLETLVPSVSQLNPNVSKFIAKNNCEEICAVPKLCLTVGALKCSPPKNASCKKKLSKHSVGKGLEPNSVVSELKTKNNCEEIITVPNVPLQVETLKFSTPINTSSKTAISKSTTEEGSEPNSNAPKLVTKSNCEEIFAVPKLPLEGGCSTPGNASCKKTKSKQIAGKGSGLKKAATKPFNKVSLKKSVPAKIPCEKVNKNSSNKVSKNNTPSIRVTNSIYPRRTAALTAEVRISALQAPAKLSAEAKMKAKKSKSRGRALKYKPLSFKRFKKIMAKIHREIKPVIRQFLQLFSNHNFLQGGYNRYTHYKTIQYELEKLYGILLKILRHLSKVLTHLEGRHNRWLKKHNLYVPKKRKPFERKVNWTYPVKPSVKFKGERPVMQRKPRVRRRRPYVPGLEGDILEFWTFMEKFTGNIVPLMKLSNKIRRDIRKTRHISNEENYEKLKEMQSVALEEEHLRAPYLKKDAEKFPQADNILKEQSTAFRNELIRTPYFKNNIKKTPQENSVLKKPSTVTEDEYLRAPYLKNNTEKKSQATNNLKKNEIGPPEIMGKLTTLRNSLKSLYEKNCVWLQELFKWVEIEIQRQHVKKFLSCNDEIVAQICDEILEILWYERDLKENQRKKVLEYLEIRRAQLLQLGSFCSERNDLLPKEQQHDRCMSSLCMECLVDEKKPQGNCRVFNL